MSYTLILRILGFLLLFLGTSMLVPQAVAIYTHEASALSFFVSIIVTLVSGGLLILSCPASRKPITHREGFLIVSLGWLSASLFGSLPFIFDHTFHTFTDAYFETVSGFTTTGATVASNIEALPRAILLWRSMIQWLGGMGIILFSIALLPLLGIGGMQLYKAEVPGPVVEKIKPRIAETARSLWKVYILLSTAEVVLLMLAGMSLFDAVCHTFTTMATGGFSTRNNSIEGFGSPMVESIIVVFMAAAGINFALHYRLFHGNIKSLRRDAELKFYLTVLALASIAISLIVWAHGTPLGHALRTGIFQVVSICTTTGFSTTDFAVWPLVAQVLLLGLMFVGGCAGSTGGGMKCIRVLLVLKRCYRELFLMVHPHAVSPVKVGQRSVPDSVMRSLSGFILLYLLLFVLGCITMCACGLDFLTAISAVAAAIGNIGPGLAGVGPYETFLAIPLLGKWTLIAMMLLGRLEIFTLLILFIPEFWKK